MRISKNPLICCLPAILFLVTICSASEQWQTLKGCRLLENESNDGDSFHVEHEGREYIFRLYFVDTPESDLQVESRVAEQAEAFGVSETEVMKGGKNAAKFTLGHLRKPFDVVTRFEGARGASKLPRHYAVVRPADTKGKDLAELLVEAGWARANGIKRNIPGAPKIEELQRKEAKARREKMGLFGGKKPANPASESSFARLPPKPSSGHSLEQDPISEPSVSPPENPLIAPDPGLAITDAIVGSLAMASPEVRRDSEAASVPGAGKIDINSATHSELMTLPGIGEKTARGIIDCRPFTNVDDLQRAPNIGPTTFERVKNLVIAGR